MFRFLVKIVRRVLRIPSSNTVYREKLLCVQAARWYPGMDSMFGERIDDLRHHGFALRPGCWVIWMPDLSVRTMHDSMFHKYYEKV